MLHTLSPPSNCSLLWHVNCDPDLIYQPNSEAPTGSPGAHRPCTTASFVFKTGYRQKTFLRLSCCACICRATWGRWTPKPSSGHQVCTGAVACLFPHMLCWWAWIWKSLKMALFLPTGIVQPPQRQPAGVTKPAHWGDDEQTAWGSLTRRAVCAVSCFFFVPVSGFVLEAAHVSSINVCWNNI